MMRSPRSSFTSMSTLSLNSLTPLASPSPTSLLFSLRSHRLRIGILTMLGVYCSVSMRLNLSMAIVCMVKSSHTEKDPQTVPKGCVLPSEVEYRGTLEWTPEMQTMLFSSTFYGSLVTTVFAGRIADRYGPKNAFAWAMCMYIVVSILTPQLASTSYTSFFIARVFMGFGEGFVVPSMGSMISRWYPHSEKATMAGMCTSGFQLASLISAIISARLCSSEMAGMGIFWMTLWMLLVTDGPTDNKFVGTEERAYLAGKVSRRQTAATRVPWRHLASSRVSISIFLCHFAHNFSTGVMMAFLPMYFKEQLYLPLHQVGSYTIVFFLGQLISKYAGGILADYLNNSNTFSFTTTAKIMQAFGGYLSLVALTLLALLPSCTEHHWALISLGLFGLGSSATYSGFFTALVSVSPLHSGVLTSISSFWSIVGNILGPVLDGAAKWTVVFLVGGAAMGLSSTAFLFWGSADDQHWEDEDEEYIKEHD